MIPGGEKKRGGEPGNKLWDSGLRIIIEEQRINISGHNLLCRIQGGLGEGADGGSRVRVSQGGGIVSVALLAGVLNIETKAQRRKKLKFNFDDLRLLLHLGLSWSCHPPVRAGVLVVCVCVFCARLCTGAQTLPGSARVRPRSWSRRRSWHGTQPGVSRHPQSVQLCRRHSSPLHGSARRF